MLTAKEKRQREYARASALIIEAKSVPCKDCGVSYPWYVMDFNHRGDKKFNIGASRHFGCKKLKAEIAKCDVICSNCHRLRTYAHIIINPGSSAG